MRYLWDNFSSLFLPFPYHIAAFWTSEKAINFFPSYRLRPQTFFLAEKKKLGSLSLQSSQYAVDDAKDELTTCEQKAIISQKRERRRQRFFYRQTLFLFHISSLSSIHQRWSPSVWNFQFFSARSSLISFLALRIQMFSDENCFIVDEEVASRWLMKNLMWQSDMNFLFRLPSLHGERNFPINSLPISISWPQPSGLWEA